MTVAFLLDSLAVITHSQVLVCIAAALLGLGGLESASTGVVSGRSSGRDAVICLMAALGLRRGFVP